MPSLHPAGTRGFVSRTSDPGLDPGGAKIRDPGATRSSHPHRVIKPRPYSQVWILCLMLSRYAIILPSMARATNRQSTAGRRDSGRAGPAAGNRDVADE